MSLAASQTQLTNSSSRTHLCFYATRIPPKTLIFTLPISARHGGIPSHFEILGHRASTHDLKSSKNLRWPLRVFESEGTVQREGLDKFNLDDFLSIAELLCLVPSVVLSIGCAVNWVFSSSQKSLQVSLVGRFFVWQFVLLVGAVVFGSLIRRRHWRRICRDSIKSGGSSFDLVERIEKLEEDLRSSVTIIRVLSRQLEKLGIRFRVTRKTLKEPITETAALAKKNSEATRALAIQEDILERELGEIQKALLAMQEQQQKQLQLILAIGKAGKLRENIRESVAKEEMIGQINSAIENEGAKQMETQTQTQTGARHKGSNNDKA